MGQRVCRPEPKIAANGKKRRKLSDLDLPVHTWKPCDSGYVCIRCDTRRAV